MAERIVRDRLRGIVYKRLEELEEYVEIDETALQNFLKQVRENQSLSLAVLAGAVAAAAGAGLWAVIAAALKMHIGFMALALGALVGLTVRRFGQGFDRVFGLAGALLALAGCAGAIVLTVVILASQELGVSSFNLLSRVNPGVYLEIWKLTIQPVHIFFYALAILEGYKFSIKRISDAELRSFTHK
jgi:hypothetical protein